MVDYKALSDEELVKGYRENKDNLLLAAIFGRFEKIVAVKAASFFEKISKTGIDFEDIMQEGRLGLLNAIESYDSSKNDKFAPFAILCIQRAQSKFIESFFRQKNQPMLNFIPIGVNDGEEGEGEFYDPPVESTEDITLRKVRLKELLEKLVDESTEMELNVLKYLAYGYNSREIASILGWESKDADNAVTRLKKKGKNVAKNQDG